MGHMPHLSIRTNKHSNQADRSNHRPNSSRMNNISTNLNRYKPYNLNHRFPNIQRRESQPARLILDPMIFKDQIRLLSPSRLPILYLLSILFLLPFLSLPNMMVSVLEWN